MIAYVDYPLLVLRPQCIVIKFAADYVTKWGIPANVLDQAASAADLLGLEGFARTLWIERAAGHWMNLEATGQGV